MKINLNELLTLTSDLHILYVENDIVLRKNTAILLNDLFAHMDEASNDTEALTCYHQNPLRYDILIADLNMPHMNGIQFIKNIQRINPHQLIIVLSARNETEYFLEGIRNHVSGYILKPIDFEQLLETLFHVSTLAQERKTSAHYKEKFQQMIDEKDAEIEHNSQLVHEFLTIDKITQLPNATMLYSFLESCSSEQECTIMLYNIDDFSFINQTYGAHLSDEILKTVGQYLRYNIAEDVHLYRYNSDEFAIVFDQKVAHPEIFAVQIQAFFSETPVGEYHNKPLHVTLSCGIATCKNPALLLPNARIALREARMRGLPNQYNIYRSNDLLLKRFEKETNWIQKFRLALEDDRIVPYFQPIVDNKTGKISKYECLARIEDDGEIISPVHFVEAARRSGLMSSLTRVMINKSFKIFSHQNVEFSLNEPTAQPSLPKTPIKLPI